MTATANLIENFPLPTAIAELRRLPRRHPSRSFYERVVQMKKGEALANLAKHFASGGAINFRHKPERKK